MESGLISFPPVSKPLQLIPWVEIVPTVARRGGNCPYRATDESGVLLGLEKAE